MLSLENQMINVNQTIEQEMITEDAVSGLIDEKIDFATGQFINRE